MEVFNLFWRNVKWRFQNPVTIMMTLIQPLIWLLLFGTIFGGSTFGSNGGGRYTAFILPGILVMVVLTSSGMSGIANYSLKTGGSFYRIFISPVKRSSIVLGHILDSVVLSFIEILILLSLSLLLGVRVETGLLGLLLMVVLLFLTVFFVSSMSYAMSFLFKDENPFIALVNTFMLPLFFVSTALMPYEQIPIAFRVPVLLNPCTYVINGLRNMITETSVDGGQLLFAVGLLILLCILSFVFAVHSLKKESR